MKGKIKQTGARSWINIQDPAKTLEETPPHDSIFLKLELIHYRKKLINYQNGKIYQIDIRINLKRILKNLSIKYNYGKY